MTFAEWLMQPVLEKLDQVLDKIDSVVTNNLSPILQKEIAMSAELDALTAQVQATVGVEASVVTLLNGVSAQIAALAASGGTPAQFQALSDQLKAQTDLLSAAAATVNPPTP